MGTAVPFSFEASIQRASNECRRRAEAPDPVMRDAPTRSSVELSDLTLLKFGRGSWYTSCLVFRQTSLDQRVPLVTACLHLMCGSQRIDAWRLDMKALLYSATFAILVSTPVFSADSVSLIGSWAGQRDRIAKIEGRRGGLATLVITEQQGNTFVGRLKRSNSTGDEEEPLWGAFTPGGKLMMGSDEEGTYIFDLIDQNTLDYCYSETGPSPRSVCARLTRQPDPRR
jgi:hypothetical protein